MLPRANLRRAEDSACAPLRPADRSRSRRWSPRTRDFRSRDFPAAAPGSLAAVRALHARNFGIKQRCHRELEGDRKRPWSVVPAKGSLSVEKRSSRAPDWPTSSRHSMISAAGGLFSRAWLVRCRRAGRLYAEICARSARSLVLLRSCWLRACCFARAGSARGREANLRSRLTGFPSRGRVSHAAPERLARRADEDAAELPEPDGEAIRRRAGCGSGPGSGRSGGRGRRRCR